MAAVVAPAAAQPPPPFMATTATEGPEKATRSGSEREPIKIPHRNPDYISKSTRHFSLLVQPRPHRYRKTIDHGSGNLESQ
jgi:hypothetical protein